MWFRNWSTGCWIYHRISEPGLFLGFWKPFLSWFHLTFYLSVSPSYISAGYERLIIDSYMVSFLAAIHVDGCLLFREGIWECRRSGSALEWPDWMTHMWPWIFPFPLMDLLTSQLPLELCLKLVYTVAITVWQVLSIHTTEKSFLIQTSKPFNLVHFRSPVMSWSQKQREEPKVC